MTIRLAVRRALLLGALLTAVAPLGAQTGRVRFRVKAPTGEAMPRAEVFLLGSHDKPIASVEANLAGEIVWTHLPWRDCHFLVSSPGYVSGRPTVIVRNSEEQLVEVTLAIPVERYYPPLPVQPAKHRWWQIFR